MYTSRSDWRRNDPNIRPSSVATSYNTSPPLTKKPSKTALELDHSDEKMHKLARRPIPGKSVAALQQQHQWFMQRSMSPSGSVRSNASSERGIPQQQQRLSPLSNNHHQQEDYLQHPQEGVEDRPVSPSATIRSEQSSLAASTGSSQQTIIRRLSTSSSQESKVAREGWIYRKNSLMQWKSVYAVAKHGNAVKPGGLYIYKDDKFSSHIHTYDMSQVVEVEPRSQEYKPGVKWEFRMLIKRDDVFFAADDLPTRKAWIDALTAIMGKVSMASHSELQSRVADADQVNRELQSRMAESDQANRELQMAMDQLQAENQELEDQITVLQKEAAKMRQDHMARHKDMTADMDDLQQSMDTRCEMLEREVSIWRNKSAVLEKELQEQQDQHQQETEQLKNEIQEWRDKVQQQSSMSLENIESSSSNSSLRETITSVKYNLQALRDHMRSDNGPLVQSHIIDIKSGVNRLTDLLEDTRRGWGDLQTEVRECLINNKNSNNSSEHENAAAELRRELLGDDDTNDDNKSMSVSAKLNVMMQMVELLQLSQTKLMESYMEHADEETKGVHIDKARMESVQAMFEDIQAKINNSTVTTSERDNGDDDEDEEALGAKLAQWMEDIKAVNREAHDKHGAQLQELVEHNIQADHDREQTIAQLLEQMHAEQEKTTDKISAMIQQLQRQQQQPNASKKSDTYQDGSKDNISSTTAEEVHQLVEGTQDFIERTLLVLDRYNHSGVEETVRRAVKSAFNSHLGANWQENTAKENEEKLKRYEETARTYIDRSMTGMQEHMVEYLGEMYGMIEELVKMAVARLEQQIGSKDGDGALEHMKNGAKRSTFDDAATSELVQVYRKLCGTRDVLEAEIERFHQERSELVKEIDDLKSTCAQVRREVEDSKIALQSIKTEYEKVQDDMQRKQHERLACELEPLMQQISKLKQLASYNSSVSGSSDEDDSVSSPSGGYVDLGHLSHPPPQSAANNRSRPSSPLPAGGATFNTNNRPNLQTPSGPRAFAERRGSFDASTPIYSDTNWKTSHDSRPTIAGGRERPPSQFIGYRTRK
ncbi:hypothetical protein K492DRAFT_207811 [Lichtheimia hyalospora FSU 10163]|nr:hypothetical protein K492DRAFT_207811 [Lichtheimia hyalospora FSU 10163]